MHQSVRDGVQDALRSAAEQAVLPRFRSLDPADTMVKSGDELVTIADREAEVLLSDALRLILPQARVVGEEACAANPALTDRLDDGLVWIIDPIDGTRNFAAGREPFAMMIALLDSGRTIGAWILEPVSGRLAEAELGAGAWIDGRRLGTEQRSVPLEALHGIASDVFIPDAHRGLIDALRKGVGRLDPTLRCAGHEYPQVATEERHFALYWRTLVWDHAPGALVLTEAGGSVTHLDGSPYEPARPRSGLMLAANPLIGKSLLDLFKTESGK